MMGPNKSNNGLVLPSSANDLAGLISFLNDKKATEAHFKKLILLTEQANDALNKITGGKQLESLLIEADQLNARAKEAMAGKDKEAATIIHNAEREAAEILSKAGNEAKMKVDRANKSVADCKTTLSQLDARERAVTVKEKDVIKRTAIVVNRESAVSIKEDEVERKRQILTQL